MFPYEVYKRLRLEQRELAIRIGKLAQFINDHDNKVTDDELSDDYMDILRDQLESMRGYNVCLVQRIGLAVTEGIAPQERSRGNQAIRRDVNKFRESCEPDPRDPAPKQDSPKQDSDKQDSDKVVADEDEHNFFGFCSGWVVDPFIL